MPSTGTAQKIYRLSIHSSRFISLLFVVGLPASPILSPSELTISLILLVIRRSLVRESVTELPLGSHVLSGCRSSITSLPWTSWPPLFDERAKRSSLNVCMKPHI